LDNTLACSNLPTYKMGAAIRRQAPTVAANLPAMDWNGLLRGQHVAVAQHTTPKHPHASNPWGCFAFTLFTYIGRNDFISKLIM
jgi:hypothetical protein